MGWSATALKWPTAVDSASGAKADSLMYFHSMSSMPAVAPPSLGQPLLAPPPPGRRAPHMFPACQGVEIALAAEIAAAESASVSDLSGTIPGPELGTEEMPTVGSMNHHFGTCKPCAFLFRQGCENGVRCPFCHLCDPDEKKRRRKMKKAYFQMKKELRPLFR